MDSGGARRDLDPARAMAGSASWIEALAHRLHPHDRAIEAPAPLRAASVLALLIPDDDHEGHRLLFIERPKGRSVHAGQIAFPGGKPEACDRHLLDTALRETHEEIGLRSDFVEVLGRLEPVPTPTGFFIVPFVAVQTRPWDLRPAPAEVASVLTPTLTRLSDPSIHSIHGVRHYQGVDHVLHQFDVSDPPIWGATARMTWDLLARLGRVDP